MWATSVDIEKEVRLPFSEAERAIVDHLLAEEAGRVRFGRADLARRGCLS